MLQFRIRTPKKLPFESISVVKTYESGDRRSVKRIQRFIYALHVVAGKREGYQNQNGGSLSLILQNHFVKDHIRITRITVTVTVTYACAVAF